MRFNKTEIAIFEKYFLNEILDPCAILKLFFILFVVVFNSGSCIKICMIKNVCTEIYAFYNILISGGSAHK